MIENLALTDDQIALAGAAKQSILACAGLDMTAQRIRLEEDGLIGMLAPEGAAGLGLGLKEAWPVIEAAGAHLLGFPLAEAIIGQALGVSRAGVAWQGEPVASALNEQWHLSGPAGRATGLAAAERIVVATRDGLFAVGARDERVEIVPAVAIDLERSWHDVLLRNAPAVRLNGCHDARWVSLAGAVLRAADNLGAAAASHADTCSHVATRHQFGKPLSAQQIIATTLAADHFRLESARWSIAYAALAVDDGLHDADDAVDAAIALSGDALVGVAENAIQLHGAIGFTAEMPLHRRLRRILAARDVEQSRYARERLAARFIDRVKAAA